MVYALMVENVINHRKNREALLCFHLFKSLKEGLIGYMPLCNSQIGDMPLQKSTLEICHSNFPIPLRMPLCLIPQLYSQYILYTHVQRQGKRTDPWPAKNKEKEKEPQKKRSRSRDGSISYSTPAASTLHTSTRYSSPASRNPHRFLVFATPFPIQEL